MFFFGGGKCPNLGVVNVRILGVVNVLLANDSQSSHSALFFPHKLHIKAPQTVLLPPGETVDQGGDLVGGPRRLRHLLFNQAEGRALVRYFNGESLVKYVPGNM